MIELNTLILNKFTLNSGHIFVNSALKAKETEEVLKQLNIGYNTMIIKNDGVIYFGFKVYRLKKQLLKLCVRLKEVLG